MQKRTGHVLKSNEVQLDGKFQLNASQTQAGRTPQGGSFSSSPQVRILENNPEYAVIGVTCCCGTEMSIRCDYADAQADKNPDK